MPANPLLPESSDFIRRMQARNIISSGQADRIAVLGDGNGRVQYEYDKRYYYVRFPQGEDDNGDTAYSAPEPVLASGESFTVSDGYPVMVCWRGGIQVVCAPSALQMITNDINPAAQNLMIPERQFLDLRSVSLGFVVRVGTSATPTMEIYVHPCYFYDDTNTRIISSESKLDLSSYVPSASAEGDDQHRLVGVFIKIDGTKELVAGTPKVSDIPLTHQIEVNELLTKASPRSFPLAAFKLTTGQTLLADIDKFTDLRIFFNSLSRKHNFSASMPPTANDDFLQQYEVGSMWLDINNKLLYDCFSSEVGNAIWKLSTNTYADNVLIVDKNPLHTQYPTIQAAYDSIIDASNANRYIIRLGAGTWVENVIAKPHIFLIADDYRVTRISGSFTYNVSDNVISFANFNNILFLGPVVLNYSNTGGKFVRFFDCRFGTSLTATGTYPGFSDDTHSIELNNCAVLNTTFNNMNVSSYSGTSYSNVTLNGATYMQHHAGEINGTFTLNDSSYCNIRYLPISFVDPFDTPLLELIINGTTLSGLDVNNITWQTGNRVRISFNGLPDLSSVSVGDWITVSSATKSENNGNFQVVTVNAGSYYVDIANPLTDDNSYDEIASPAIAEIITEHPTLITDKTSLSLVKTSGTWLEHVSLQIINGESAGIVTPKPSILNNGDGTITVSSLGCFLYDNANQVGELKRYNIAGNSFTLTNNADNFLVVNYNSGIPVLQCTTANTHNNSDIIFVSKFYREGMVLHYGHQPLSGEGLINKVALALDLEEPVRFAKDARPILGETATPVARTVTVTSGTIIEHSEPFPVKNINSSTNGISFYYHVAGVWTKSTITQYNNTQYDNGTNLVALAGNQWTINWVYRGIEYNPDLYIILGSNNYSTLAAAQAITTPPTPPPLFTAHTYLVGRIIVQNGQNTGTVENVTTTTFSSSTVTNHNDLANIQQAGTGITYGHIDAGTQSIAGTKTFLSPVTAPNFISNVATGTQPYATTSTTVNTNLNADKIDGRDETEFALLAGRAGGQSLTGGTGASENLTFYSTSNATKGNYNFPDATGPLRSIVVGGDVILYRSAADILYTPDNIQIGGSFVNFTGIFCYHDPTATATLKSGSDVPANYPYFILQRARNTYGVPASVQAGDVTGAVNFYGYNAGSANYVGTASFLSKVSGVVGNYLSGSLQFRISSGVDAGANQVAFECTPLETVFNNDGLNVDFRVEGDTDPNLLLIDASTDTAHIGKLNINNAYTFPTADGANTYVLSTNGLGVVSWVAPPAGSSPLTTKGDLYTYSTINDRLPVGTNNSILIADDTQPTGLRWDSKDNIGALVYNSANISINNNTSTILTFDSEYWDDDNIHSTITNTDRLTCTRGGSYLIWSTVSFASSAVGRRRIQFELNNGVIIAGANMMAIDTGGTNISLSTVIKLVAGDYVRITVLQASGGALNVAQLVQFSPIFGMVRIGS